MQSLRSIGYNFKTAVADLIDNSVSANSSNVRIFYEASIKEPYLSILDDGRGMSESELVNAMKYGTQSPNEVRKSNDLGRFGLGMKSASLSQCKKMTVISKKNKNIYGASWDLDHIAKTNEWSVLTYKADDLDFSRVFGYEELKDLKNGTLIIWEKFDRIPKESFQTVFQNKIDETEDHLALVFHRFMENKRDPLRIYINENEVSPINPFLRNNMSTQAKQVQKKEIHGEVIEVQPFILPHINKMTRQEIQMLGGKSKLKTLQGYYVYRNRRLIKWGDWFNQFQKEELAKLVRVQVDIPNSLDDLWEIDIKKSEAVLPYVIRKNLGTMISDALDDGRTVIRYRGRKKNKDDHIVPVWNRYEERESIHYSINRDHNVIKEIMNDSKCSEDIDKVLKIVERNIPHESIYVDKADSLNMKKYEEDRVNQFYEILKDMPFENAKYFLESAKNVQGFQISDEQKSILLEWLNNHE